MSEELGQLIPLPISYITDPVQKADYEALEKAGDKAALLAKFKWWSLIDLIQEYGQGFVAKLNTKNFLKYKLDLSAEELKNNPMLEMNINRIIVPELAKINQAVLDEERDLKMDAANQASKNVMDIASARPRMPMAMGGKKKWGKGGADGEPAYSVANLEKVCLDNLSKVPFRSDQRIFVTDGVVRLPQGGGKTRKGKGKKRGTKAKKTHRRRK